MSANMGASTPKLGNRIMMSLLEAPVVGGVLGKELTILTFTGRKTGRTYRTPVGYKRTGVDTITLQSKFGTDGKTWWRNFTGDGAHVTVLVDGTTHPGHAVAVKDGEIVTVTITLTNEGESR